MENELKPGDIIFFKNGKMFVRRPTAGEKIYYKFTAFNSFVWYRIICPILASFIKEK
jgi:hypothetical protein